MELAQPTQPCATIERHCTPDFDTAFEAPPLPVDERALKRLVRRHGLAALLNFCDQHADEFRQSCALVYAGDASLSAEATARDALDRIGLQQRRLYRLVDSDPRQPPHYYFFLLAQDENAVRGDANFVLWYGRQLIALNAPPVTQPLSKTTSSTKSTSNKRRADELQLQVLSLSASPSPSPSAVKQPRLQHQALVVHKPEPEETDQRALVALEDVRTLFREQVRELTTDLALSRELCAEKEKRHKLELELKDAEHAKRESALRQEFQKREVELYKQMLANGGKLPQQLMPAMPQYKITKLEDWVSPKNPWAKNLPDLGARQLPRHHKLYENPQITPQIYAALARQLRFDGARLYVPLSYTYLLRDVLQALRQSMPNQQAQVDRLMERCPERYKIVLRRCEWGQQLPTVCDALNNVNLSVVMVHAQAVVLVHAMNEKARSAPPDAPEKKTVQVTRLAPLHPLETSPDPDIMDAYYPLSQYSGPGTYVTPYMSLRIANPTFAPSAEPSKIGGNKFCKFCWTRDRILGTTATDFQFTHQTRTCPLLANLSNNEAVILATLYAACSKTKGNEERAAGLLAKNKQEFLFTGVESLMRLATPEELATGQSWAGLRLNQRVFNGVRDDVAQLLEHQLKAQIGQSKRRPVFGAIDPQLYWLVERLYPHKRPQELKLSQLLLDSTGTRLFEIRKRPSNELYFSLQRMQSPQAAADAQYQEWERHLQQERIQQYQQGLLY